MKCNEYTELVAAHADGALSGDELAGAERHAGACPPCEALRRGQLAVKSLLARRRAFQSAPDSLRTEITRRTVGGTVGDTTESDGADSRSNPWKTRILATGAIAATLLLTLGPLLLRNGDIKLVDTIAADVGRVGSIAPELATGSPAELRSYYAHNGITFEHSVEDLEPYGIRLVGGSISRVGDVPTTLTIYDAGGAPVVCRRFRAGQLELPSGGRRFNKSELYEHKGVHVALTEIDGGVICAMASRTPFEELFASAHARRAFSLR